MANGYTMKGVAIFISKQDAEEFSYATDALANSPKIFWEDDSREGYYVWFDGKKERPILDYLVKYYITLKEGQKKYPWLFL